MALFAWKLQLAPVSAPVNVDDEAHADQARIRELEKQVSKLQKQKEAFLKELDLVTAKYRDWAVQKVI